MASGVDWLPEFDREMAQTRKLLERIPEDCLGWRPHPRSWTLAELATHLAWIGAWIPITLQQAELDLASPATPPSPKPVNSRAGLMAMFDGLQGPARRAIEGADGEGLRTPWTLRAGEQVVFTLSRAEVLRTFVMNHLIHHRGQLEVYLRINEVPLPAIYGPSADEGGM